MRLNFCPIRQLAYCSPDFEYPTREVHEKIISQDSPYVASVPVQDGPLAPIECVTLSKVLDRSNNEPSWIICGEMVLYGIDESRVGESTGSKGVTMRTLIARGMVEMSDLDAEMQDIWSGSVGRIMNIEY